ncbi:hypothetical protein [Streptomyces halobius]|uniref:SPW repeat-containing protein n=1 Tax=Streptomyces halobius TaxID=2879846 RepID=A0ABY4M0C8_9ACTN|nr:hypothetical protein [Streptomyces halobius]UQA91185.1 hypothetical protein K9S39_04175 [Streptomyces halobius]
MSTPPETPSPRSIAREVAGLVLVAAGILVVLVALGAIHPLLSTSVAAAGTFAAFRFPAPPRSNVSRVVACAISAIATTTAVGCAFAYCPPLAWVEVGAGICAAGMWLASEAT